MPPDADQHTDDPLLAYLRMLAGPGDPTRFLDFRWRRPGGVMRRRFICTERLQDAVRLVGALAARNDVYVGVAPRDGNSHGGLGAIGSCHLAFVDSDRASTVRALSVFLPAPSMVIASGTPGHHQIYWQLQRPCAPGELQSANRRLALALHGDPACADAARILRPPQTFNHKHSPPTPVTLLALAGEERCSLSELIAGLPPDPAPQRDARASPAPRRGRSALDTQLLAIPAAEYVRVLAGRTPNREGKVLCPFHQERDPSLQLYADGGFYCFGSGCGAGGSIFDFAARLWGISPRGVGFIQLRERLALSFELNAAGCA